MDSCSDARKLAKEWPYLKHSTSLVPSLRSLILTICVTSPNCYMQEAAALKIKCSSKKWNGWGDSRRLACPDHLRNR